MCRTINLALPTTAGVGAGAENKNTLPSSSTSNTSTTSNSTKSKSKPFSIHTHSYPRDWRRRSADVGGLHLALAASAAAAAAAEQANDDANSASGRDSLAGENFNGSGEAGSQTFGAQGQGWMGGEPGDVETMFAELLSDMYQETQSSVIENTLDSTPPQTTVSTRTRLIWSLNRWNFEPHLLDEDELIACTIILFEALFRIEGMQETIPVSMQQITSFIHHLRRIYRYENTYHNFEHALDVLQATQSYLRSAGIVPPTTLLFEPEDRKWTPKTFKKRGKEHNGVSGGGGGGGGGNVDTLIGTLGLRELFMLYVAAIGHDVGHPGFNNHFMKNAQAPLSLIYNSSALEQMHCQLLLKVMRLHGLGTLLDDPTHGAHCRKVLVQSILTTDMSVHDEFMGTLKALVDGEQAPLCQRQIVMCQAILKNADISNPTRPFLVSKHWASALMKEWFAQATLEESYGVKQTVYPSDNPIDEANGQIFFISRFAKPLLELTERAVPEMRMYGTHCKVNLKEWNRKKKELKKELDRLEKEKEKGPVPLVKSISVSSASSSASSSPSLTGSTSNLSPRMFQCYHSAFRLTLPRQQPFSSSSGSSASGTSSTNGAKSERDQEEEFVPASPSETESSSALFSPISESANLNSHIHSISHSHSHSPSLNSHRFPSNASVTSTALSSIAASPTPSFLSVPGSISIPTHIPPTPPIPPTHAAIRAASKAGSMRKKSQTNLKDIGASISGRRGRGVRNSWCSGVGVDGSEMGENSFAAFFQAQSQAQKNGMSSAGGALADGTPNSPPPASAPPNLGTNGRTQTQAPTILASSSLAPSKLPVPP